VWFGGGCSRFSVPPQVHSGSMRRPYIREFGYQIAVRPNLVLRHFSVCKDAYEPIERIVGEGPAVVGKRRRARRVVRQHIWQQRPGHPPRVSGWISARVLQSMREGSKETLIVCRFTRQIGVSLFHEYDGLRRPRSALHLDPAAAMTWDKRTCPQPKLPRPQSRVG